MLSDMFLPGTVAVLARHAGDEAAWPVAVARTRDVLKPGVMAFHTPDRGFTAKIPRPMGIKMTASPPIEGIQPRHGQFVKSITVPGEINLVGLPACSEYKIDPGGGPLFASGSRLN